MIARNQTQDAPGEQLSLFAGAGWVADVVSVEGLTITSAAKTSAAKTSVAKSSLAKSSTTNSTASTRPHSSAFVNRYTINPHLLAARRLARKMRKLPDRSPEETQAGLAICRQLKAFLRDEIQQSDRVSHPGQAVLSDSRSHKPH